MVFVSCQFYLALFTVNSGSFSIFRSICLFLNLAIHFSENLGIFRVALLFICQRSVILRCCCSQRQLWYLIMSAFVCQQLFLIFSNLFSNRKTFVSAVDFHTTILFPALSTTFYIYFSKHLQWHKRRKKRNLNLLRFFSYFLLVVNGERGIWTLAPVARPTPLAGAPLRPLEYFSAVIKKIFNCILTHFFVRRVSHCIKENLKCQANLSMFFLFFYFL